MLYVVSTPIGNLKDITLRAIETLKSVSLIAAEDTRNTRKLLAHYDIHTPLTSYFEGNEPRKAEKLLELLRDGRDIALVSDSGTPGISDPGYRVIKMAIENGLRVTHVPGPSALICALVLSGAPTDEFTFAGFLPRKQGKRLKQLREYLACERTVVLYESPHRIIQTLKDINEADSGRTIVILREMTKKFEEVKRGRAAELLAHFEAAGPRGELVIVIPAKE